MQRLRRRPRGFLRTVQRRGGQVGDPGAARGTLAEVFGKHPGHLLPQFGEVEFREPSVENAVGIVDLAVAEQMDSGLGHVYQFLKDGVRSEIFRTCFLQRVELKFLKKCSETGNKRCKRMFILDAAS
ncbi:hypothetical protein NicSoilC5_20030 [Arthrobacter sp. NicSoilC5]|nr:hypothetical protein NicSoilC5_20030 [Arthrobacter sp. NicSoilC5]